jgi:hypothetical protein
MKSSATVTDILLIRQFSRVSYEETGFSFRFCIRDKALKDGIIK